MRGKRKARMGSKEVATAYTAAAKLRREGKNRKRRGPATEDEFGLRYLKDQANDRWPEDRQCDLYFELNTTKKAVGRPSRGRIKPPTVEFALLESIDARTLDILLTAASLKVKRVKRNPGWVLQRTYNLKNRPIQII